MNDLITVVIPVYKVEKYIYRCVDSVINQTYKNLEIILVDDGSPDNCPKICDEYAKKNSRIKVIHKKNGGLSDARNVGIEAATGKYITFIDSDDWIPLSSIEKLYENIKKYDADISSGSLLEVFSSLVVEDKNECYEINCYTTKDALRKLMLLHEFSNSASGKIYKIDCFENVRYPLGKLYEDLGTTYILFSNAKKIVSTNMIVYYYYQNKQSIVHNKFSNKRLDGYYFAIDELKFIEKNYPDLLVYAQFRLFYECLSILNDMPLYCSDKNKIRKTIKKYRKSVLNINDLYRKQKLICYTSYFGQICVKFAFMLRGFLKKKVVLK